MIDKETRIKNLKTVIKQKHIKVQMPGFKKHSIPEKYVVFYSSRDANKLFDTIHLTNEYQDMLNWEIYQQAMAYNLDTGGLVAHKVRECSCHPLK